MTQDEALRVLKTGANVYLTGEPGSGKTHTINTFVEWLRASGIEPSVTAATGIAATHISGMTLHSWSGIGIADHLSAADIDRIASREQVAKRIAKAQLLIIDEISMLSAATFELVDRVCREVRRKDEVFGGLTLVLVGDFFQLPPISRGNDTAFAYTSATWRELNPLICYLTEQYRQDDNDFLNILSAIRSGLVEELHHEQLQARRIENADALNVPKLFSHNADVDHLNAEELSKLPGKPKRFVMTSKGKASVVDGLMRGCLSPEILELKEGAAVMFTKNSPQGKFANGTLGQVTGFDSADMPIVKKQDGLTIIVDPAEWRLEEQGKVRASIVQIPLRLAYAMTVHKSQGMSMDAAVIDLSRAFEYGQGYVALSRVRRLSGLHLLGINARALEVHPAVREKDRDLRAASSALRERFDDMPETEITEMQKKFVKAIGGAWMTNSDTTKKNIHTGMPARLAETLQTVRDAKTLKETVKERGLTLSTIVKHLEELAEMGKLEQSDFVHLLPDTETTNKIQKALAAAPDERLSPAFHALGGRYSFELIRLVRLVK